MIRKVQILSLVIVVTLVFGSIHSTGLLAPIIIEPIDNVNASGNLVDSLLTDPFFTQSPDVIINGSSDEFSSRHHAGVGGPDVSYLELNWTHTPGTHLDFIGADPDSIIPDYNDFIYGFQEFQWPYEQVPANARGSINYSTYLSGDFANESLYGHIMFRLYVWIIDSSGEWTRIYESREAVYFEHYQRRTLDLNYFALRSVFEGMVEEGGIQEDPEDKAYLAIGLAPRFTFESFDGAEPWTYFDGTVSFRIGYADLYTIVEDDTSSNWQPKYNNTYSTTFGDVFPTHPNATDEIWNDIYGMVIDEVGSVYITGNSISPYEIAVEEGLRFSYQYIAKYSSSLDLQWEVQNDNQTAVRAMTFFDGYIYTTGYEFTESEERNLIVTKWSTSGIKEWEDDWGADGDQVGVGITVSENGTIIIIANDYSLIPFQEYSKTDILSYDTAGNRLSLIETDYPFVVYGGGGELFIVENQLHFKQGLYTSHIAMNGTFLGGFRADAVTSDSDGNIYTAINGIGLIDGDPSFIYVEVINSTDYIQWNATFSVIWPNGWYLHLVPRDIVITPDNEILVLVQQYNLGYDTILLTFDMEGNLISNQSMGTDYWPSPSGLMYMEVGKSGLVYCAFNIYFISYDAGILAFEAYTVPGGFEVTILTLIIIASVVVIIGAGAGILRWKRRNSLNTQ